MLDLQQPNLDLVTDEKSAHEALKFIIDQMCKKSGMILSLINTRLPEWKNTRSNLDIVKAVSNEFMDEVFQPLIVRVAEISPAEPEQRDHPLRRFNHDILLNFPENFQQMLVYHLAKSDPLKVQDIIKLYS